MYALVNCYIYPFPISMILPHVQTLVYNEKQPNKNTITIYDLMLLHKKLMALFSLQWLIKRNKVLKILVGASSKARADVKISYLGALKRKKQHLVMVCFAYVS